ncbi:MAG TPA: radical SAM family heme chaperone HemW [Candidatus Binatia bacterium]|nr:radical SAM family heme chaperone HemW [Candidatus Binatia bacterium]
MGASYSLYLHIPFCRHRCAYCDFNTYTSLGDLQAPYAQALTKELAQVASAAPERQPAAHTVFFGGGTPSLMAAADLAVIMASARRHFQMAPDAEVTVEANPGTVDRKYLRAIRELGVNRLSFGMQSAVGSELALLEREHDLRTVVEAVRLSRAAGFANVSVDLIYGLPNQSIENWRTSLEAALALGTEHLSLYCLTIEPGTPMQRWLRQGRIPAPDPDVAADQYALACDLLDARGWEHYEISNWAQPGHASRHNLTYWRNGAYLGLGAGAHGHAAGYRYEVVKQPRVYLRRMTEDTARSARSFPLSPAVAQAHALSQREKMADTMITQLRLLQEGVNLAAFEDQFGCTVREAFDGTVDQLVDWDLLMEQEGRLLLTQRGWFLSNQVFYRFV